MPGVDDARPVEYLGGPIRRLFMRYPWHVSGVIGVLLITGLRPCTRHVPEPPPIVAPMPAFDLLGPGGVTVTDKALHGDIWIAGFVCLDCSGAPAEIAPTLHAIASRVATHDKPMRFLAVGTQQGDTPEALAAWAASPDLPPTRWLTLSGPQGATDALRAEVTRALGGQAPEIWARIFIIDDRGRLRGSYALGERGADEIYHRAQHVALESRGRRDAGRSHP